ncbi:DMSO/selenate family reductase complex A subunit [Shewanella gelidii]|uniref:Dimethyl sulfoxide reductase subunit A n=1 Tax=Shewanella gelidii TaxID=1642821 RepID=A0A917JUA3_9GAMM|nr:DMSO/selenate family reductase complex A subunit [Shewanella gelidii]MCL1098484.1 molybdopterin-dependent oxidoreductase [Shewanella gelidii]GGI82407.1 dimethyl sulfoxide reductase subunit A [Shewanella gelidii]
MERRSFLKMSAAMSCAASVVGCGSSDTRSSSDPEKPPVTTTDPQPAAEVVNWSACLVNCGSNCPLKVYSKDGVITRVSSEHETADTYGVDQQIRACPRGLSMRQRNYAPDRLTKPMKRVGPRGEGQFVAITWDEAFQEIAAKIQQVNQDYGPEAIYCHYGTGAYYGFANNKSTWHRLLNLTGGFLNHHWDYSWAGVYAACMASYGYQWDSIAGSSLSEIANSDLFVGFGFNPNEIRMSGSGEGYDFVKALESNQQNIQVYMVDPRYTDSMRGLEHHWLAIRPGTDAALIEAVIYQLIHSGWVNTNAKSFLDTYCVGFDKASLEQAKRDIEAHPEPFIQQHAQYIDPDDNYHDYILGLGKYAAQGARTATWAAAICGVTETDIVALADAIMTAQTPYITAGAGISRHANGDQATRAVYTLAMMTGKIGRSGVNSGAMPRNYGFPMAKMPTGTNPVDVTIPVFTWSDAIVRGASFTGISDGVRYTASGAVENKVDNNTAALPHNIKMVINCAGNALVNQHSDSNATAAILADESLCEMIVVCDCWMTPSARYADILLPDTTWLESEDYANDSYASGQLAYLTMMSSSLKPLGDAKSMYDICSGIAEKLGVQQAFTEGRTTQQWCEELYQQTRAKNPDVVMPESYAEAQQQGLFRKHVPEAHIAYRDYIQDPLANPRQTVSGKFEIYSISLARKAATWTLNAGDLITPLPQYVVTWDGFEDPATRDDYPIQLCGYHTKGRTHSSFHNVPWMREAVEDAVWLHPLQAQERGLTTGDRVVVFNARGTIRTQVKVTPRVSPGVAMLGQGAWYAPSQNQEVGPSGHVIDTGGCLNVLTKYHPSPIAKGNPQHTNRVQIQKA